MNGVCLFMSGVNVSLLQYPQPPGVIHYSPWAMRGTERDLTKMRAALVHYFPIDLSHQAN